MLLWLLALHVSANSSLKFLTRACVLLQSMRWHLLRRQAWWAHPSTSVQVSSTPPLMLTHATTHRSISDRLIYLLRAIIHLDMPPVLSLSSLDPKYLCQVSTSLSGQLLLRPDETF